MPEKDSPWNLHQPTVGATLLGNWVEERAVGPERIIPERDVEYISRCGHADILLHDTGAKTAQTRPAASQVARGCGCGSGSRPSVVTTATPGRLRAIKTAEWTYAATEAASAAENCAYSPTAQAPPQPKIYISTTMADFGHDYERPSMRNEDGDLEFLHPTFHPLPGCADTIANSSLKAKPLTFWSDMMHKNAHTVYCSSPRSPAAAPESPRSPSPQKESKGCISTPDNPDGFGRHAKFTTPISENVKSPHAMI